jgi:hypoxanthine-DNA glycosylase
MTQTQSEPLQGLPPVLSRRTRLLVLGSFPGAASLAAQQYYAHPHNAFWKIWGAIWGEDGLRERPYAQRIRMARAQGLGLWDVYTRCERVGSLDSAIRAATLNDFAALAARCPQLSVVAHNGGESAKHEKTLRALLPARVQIIKLPSTSPANAGAPFEAKLAAWQEAWTLAG